jgi:hypothetical protein
LIELSKVRWTECGAHVREETNVFGMLVGKPKNRDGLEDQGVDGSIVVLCTFRKRNTVRAVFIYTYCSSQQGELAGPCEQDEAPRASLNCPAFLDPSQDLLASQEGLLLGFSSNAVQFMLHYHA